MVMYISNTIHVANFFVRYTIDAYFSFFLHNEIYKYQIVMQSIALDDTRHDIMTLGAGHTKLR